MSGRVRGWCPSLFAPMSSGDGLLARVRPPLGRMGAEVARVLAEAVRQTGNGQLEITNRGALQVRGLSATSLPRLQDAVLAAGLASPDPAIERRRSLVLSPFATPAAAAFAGEVERWIVEDDALAKLPSKFGFAVAAPGRDPQALPADIGFVPDQDACLILLPDSRLAGLTRTPIDAARAIISRLPELSAMASAPPRRMGDLVRALGAEAIFSGTDLALVEAPPASATGASAIAGLYGSDFALGLAFGALHVGQLEAAASLSERFAYGSLRLSPWRAIVLSGVADPAGLAAAAQAEGFIADPGDPRLALSACVGAPACASAHAPARADAAEIGRRRPGGAVHVSGCPKGCAHPRPAAVTLVASPDGYGLVRGGRAGDAPQARGLTLDQALQLLAAEAP